MFTKQTWLDLSYEANRWRWRWYWYNQEEIGRHPHYRYRLLSEKLSERPGAIRATYMGDGLVRIDK